MSESTALGSASPLHFSPSSNHDPSLKPNPHPYAIKTTHTGLLSRTTSSGHITPSKHLYIPPTRTPSRSPTNRRHEYRGQRYSTGPTGAPPSPFTSPLESPSRSPRGQPGYVFSLRRPRADTLPTYLVNNSNASPGKDLPLDPKTWTASQLSLYLTTALRVRSGERVSERVARDIALWVRREGISGRTFLRWTDEDLKVLGVNMLWRGALLAAASNLRQSVIRERILDNLASDQEREQEEEEEQPLQPGQDGVPFSTTRHPSPSSSLDFSLAQDTGADAKRCRLSWRLRANSNSNGRVRGIVDKWERGSARSRSSSPNSSCSRRRGGSGSEGGSELSVRDVFVTGGDGDGTSDGCRAMEAGVKETHIEALDTAVPRHDGSGSNRRRVLDADITQPTWRSVAQATDNTSTSTLVEAEVQTDEVHAETEASAANLGEEECAMENQVDGTQFLLLDEFRSRLEEVEARVGAMEAEWQVTEPEGRRGWCKRTRVRQHTESQHAGATLEPDHSTGSDESVSLPPPPLSAAEITPTKEQQEEEDSRATNRLVDCGPTTVTILSDLSPYVFLVGGLGMCAVVFHVVLKRVVRRNSKP